MASTTPPIGRRTPHFTTPTKTDFSARSTTSRTVPSPSLVHGQKATSKRRWLCYSAGPTRLTVPFLRFRMHKAFSNARIRLLGHVIPRAKRRNYNPQQGLLRRSLVGLKPEFLRSLLRRPQSIAVASNCVQSSRTPL